MHSKHYESIKAKTTYILERREYLCLCSERFSFLWSWPDHLYSLKRQILSQENTHCGRPPQISLVAKQVCTGEVFFLFTYNGFHMIRVSCYGQLNLYIVVVHHSMLLAIAVLLEYKHTNWFCSMFLFAGDFSLCFKGFKCKTHNAYLGFCSTLCIMIFKFTLMILLPLLEENKELLLCAAFWAVGT